MIFRHAVRLSGRSNAWSEVVSTWIRTLPTLFDTYTNLTDGETDLLICAEPPVPTDFIFCLSKSYKRHADLLKANFPSALILIERLLLLNAMREARYFVDEVIITHIDIAVDLEALLRMLIRVCPLISMDFRNAACKDVISLITYKLRGMKLNKKHAPLCFDLVLTILDLRVVEAPKTAEYLLDKNEFYPWKELAPRFTDLIRLCAAYDVVEDKARFSDLDNLVNILRLATERGKVTTIIFRATHDETVKAILRWSGFAESDNKKIWSKHVYRMGEAMLDLIDQRQITVDLLGQFIEALRKKISVDEDQNDDQEKVDPVMVSFFTVSEHSMNFISQLIFRLCHGG